MEPHSPKRKRGSDSNNLAIRTSDIQPAFASRWHYSDPNEEDCSPRATMARKFQKLDIDTFRTTTTELSDPALGELDDRSNHQQSSFNPQDNKNTNPPSNNQEHSVHDHPDETVPTLPAFTFTAGHYSTTPNRSVSPPPHEPFSSQFWGESEITGFDPDDPNDDGYGINGIGYRPTPAIAYARSQKRKQQLLEYRNREAKEARQRRSERRRDVSGMDTIRSPAGQATGHEQSPRKVARVHFDIG